MKIYLATGNAHKVLEINRFIQTKYPHISVCSAQQLGGMPEVEETETTFAGNAFLKARALWKQGQGKEWVLADDSGISVDALDGRPGVYSARYAGDACDDEANNQKLMKELTGVPPEKRTAYYTCALALISAQGKEILFEERCYGRLLDHPVGKNGFGYDPYFIPDGQTETFGMLLPTIKDKISHRAKALDKLATFLDGV